MILSICCNIYFHRLFSKGLGTNISSVTKSKDADNEANKDASPDAVFITWVGKGGKDADSKANKEASPDLLFEEWHDDDEDGQNDTN